MSEKPELIILDDCFPNLLTAFRIAEFNAYLEAFGNGVEIHSEGRILAASTGESGFGPVWRQYAEVYPQYAGRVKELVMGAPLRAKLFYMVFAMNADKYLPMVQASDADLVFTLYPGGAFWLNQADSDERLKRVCGYKRLKKIIVTQKVSKNYLIEKGFCDEKMIEYIWGVVVPPSLMNLDHGGERPRFGLNKGELNICFVSHKFLTLGKDKGYDVFLETAKLLAKWNPAVRFHVIGNYGPADYPMDELAARLTFHGLLTTSDLNNVLWGMDMILSPNAPFILNAGGFDGFLTASCVQAGLNGTAVFCTDTLGENIYYKDGQEIVMINRNPADIFEKVRSWAERPEELAALGNAGQAVFRRMYSPERQIAPRVNLLRAALAGSNL